MRWYRRWKYRRWERSNRKWAEAYQWAVRMNEAINALPQHQQDQLDAQLREKMGKL